SHPTTLLFHLLFRSIAIAIYMFGWIFTSNFILSFVFIILMLAADFWTCKNISGRRLVGLRWWNEIKDDGTSEWIFESRENRAVNPTDSRVFWTALYASPIIWGVLSVLALLRLQFSWFLVTLVAISMSTANVVGYTKCEKVKTLNLHQDAKNKMGQFIAEQGFAQRIMGSLITNRMGSMFG
ncbi:hypothetical protein BC833DRAFT_522367, partial [Globomyces pollinis-pini]